MPRHVLHEAPAPIAPQPPARVPTRPHLRVASADKVDGDHLLGQFIPLHYHFQMLRDDVRMSPFEEAIAQVIEPGAHVLELGAGTGVLSFFAARSGAAKVWAVERLPHLARAARGFLARNGVDGRVEVVEGDAFEYLPPAPVDVVICEMLHVGMLREKQAQVISRFKQRYTARFGGRLPRFVPEATVLAVQPVEQAFDFHGYHAEVPMFLPGAQEGTRDLSPHATYASWFYDEEVPLQLSCDAVFTMGSAGTLNALRFATRNLLAVLPAQARSIDWDMNHLIAPLAHPLAVKSGDRVQVRFCYDAGDSLLALLDAIKVTRA